jgi:hypothetical protein
MTPTYNHDLKDAICTEEEHGFHKHSIPKTNNMGYYRKEVITMGMTKNGFRQCLNRGSTISINAIH